MTVRELLSRIGADELREWPVADLIRSGRRAMTVDEQIAELLKAKAEQKLDATEQPRPPRRRGRK